MSIQISVDPSGLTQEQREAVAGFILAFPGKCAGACDSKQQFNVDTADSVAALGSELLEAAVTEAEVLQHDHESTMPEAAFSPQASPAPAPFTAGAVPFQIAPEGMPAATLSADTSAPVPFALTPEPVVPAPSAPAAPTSPASGVELDKDGLPWDGRIHAESKAKNADGRWRRRRNLDDALLAKVEGELRGVMAAPAVPSVPSVPAPPAVAFGTPDVAATFPAATPAPQVAAPAPAAGADNRQLFISLVGRSAAAIQARKITQEEITGVCKKYGVEALPLLASRLDLVPPIAADIDLILAGRP